MSKNEFICDCNVIHQEIVDDTKNKMVDEDTLNKLAEFFKILGDTTRSKILFAIEENYKISSVNPASRLILNIWQRCPKEYRKTLFDLFELELQNDKTIS